MSRLVWGEPKGPSFTAGVERGVLYPPEGSPAVPWNGLTAVNERPSGGEGTPMYYDGVKYLNLKAVQDSFCGTIEAITYPDAIERGPFGLSYRVMNGNDAYKIHLVYNVSLTPSQRSRQTLNDATGLDPFSWDFTTSPVQIPNFRASSHLVVDSRIAYSWALEQLEETLYGSDFVIPSLPSLLDVVQLFENASILKITDNGDGTWTAEGPDDVVRMVDTTTFEISWPSAIYIDATSYNISSL